MKLYKEILTHLLAKQEVRVTFTNLHVDAAQLVEMECYQALKRIKAIIEDDSLKDEECFQQIEEIVCTFEALGSGGGIRHDFG